MLYGHFDSSICDYLECMSRSFIDCKLFSILTTWQARRAVPLPY